MALEVVTTVHELREWVGHARRQGYVIGFVPTMGALHAGHASLIRAARAETSFVVVSLFVNPTQFGPNEDFSRYPRTWDADVEICQNEGADLLFHPSVSEVYPAGACTYVEVEKLAEGLCGAARPGHFRGVATVVAALFHMVQPHMAYFGQKDAQQVHIIQQMVRDLHFPISIRVCPIVREPDGLALSSRNRYLTPDQRMHATVLSRALQRAATLVEHGERDAAAIRTSMIDLIQKTPHAVLDYAELVDHVTLQPVSRIQGEVLIALAVRFGGTRLIDNMILDAKPT